MFKLTVRQFRLQLLAAVDTHEMGKRRDFVVFEVTVRYEPNCQ
jgi:hypothetical protein